MSASRRDSKESKYREKIAELEDIIRHQTKEFERANQHMVRRILNFYYMRIFVQLAIQKKGKIIFVKAIYSEVLL